MKSSLIEHLEQRKPQTMDNDPFPHLQDVISTLPLLSKSYMRFLIAFSTISAASEIQEALRHALKKLSGAFPYLAGQVIIGPHDEKPRIVAFREIIELVVKDGRDNMPTMAEMRKARFPFSMLDGRILAPDIAHSRQVGSKVVAPVLMLQATFIEGGVLLGIYGNHCQMDMAGMAVIIKLLAKTLNGETLTETELVQVNQSRIQAVPFLDESISSKTLELELDDMLVKPHSFTSGGATLPSSRWVYINFSDANLNRLKAEAIRTKTSDVPFLTTDDAMGAFLWQRINYARSNTTYATTFGRVASVRRLFGLGNYYVANMCDVVYTSHTSPQPIWEIPLGVIASRLRERLLPAHDEKNRWHMQALVTALHRSDSPDKRGRLIFGANLDFARDLYVSSITKVAPVCDWKFGPVMGVPEAGRRPNLPDNTLLGLVISMPRAKGQGAEEGDLAVAACLSEEDIRILRKDKVLGEYAEILD